MKSTNISVVRGQARGTSKFASISAWLLSINVGRVPPRKPHSRLSMNNQGNRGKFKTRSRQFKTNKPK